MSRSQAIPLPSVLCVALIMTSATQLRPEGQPLGVGELGLVIWLFLAFCTVAYRDVGNWRCPPWFSRLLAFWLVAFVALAAGFVWGELAGPARDLKIERDFLAFAFAGTVSLVTALLIQTPETAARVLVAYATAIVFFMCALLAVAVFIDGIGSIQFWYSRIRFTGLAENPNQLAVFIAAVPFVVLQLGRDGVIQRKFAVTLAAMAVVAGLTTISDALSFAWLGCGVAIAVAFVVSYARAPTSSLTRVLVLWLVVPTAILALSLLFALPAFERIEAKVLAVIELGSQASIRLLLWTNGLSAMSASPWLGWGPGAYSGIAGPFQGTESHNTYIDWASSTGVFGVAALIWFIGLVMWRCLRGGKTLMALAVVALAGFAMFHFVLRQPVFWVLLVLILAYSFQDSRDSPFNSVLPSV